MGLFQSRKEKKRIKKNKRIDKVLGYKPLSIKYKHEEDVAINFYTFKLQDITDVSVDISLYDTVEISDFDFDYDFWEGWAYSKMSGSMGWLLGFKDTSSTHQVPVISVDFHLVFSDYGESKDLTLCTGIFLGTDTNLNLCVAQTEQKAEDLRAHCLKQQEKKQEEDDSFYYYEEEHIPYSGNFIIQKDGDFYQFHDDVKLDMEHHILRYEQKDILLDDVIDGSAEVSYTFAYDNEHPHAPECKDCDASTYISLHEAETVLEFPDEISTQITYATQHRFPYELHLDISLTVIFEHDFDLINIVFYSSYYNEEAQRGLYVLKFLLDYICALQKKSSLFVSTQAYHLQFTDQNENDFFIYLFDEDTCDDASDEEKEDDTAFYNENNYTISCDVFPIQKEGSFYRLTDDLQLDMKQHILRYRDESFCFHYQTEIYATLEYSFCYDEHHTAHPECEDRKYTYKINTADLDDFLKTDPAKLPTPIAKQVKLAQRLHFPYTIDVDIFLSLEDDLQADWSHSLIMISDYYKEEAQRNLYVFYFLMKYFSSIVNEVSFTYTPIKEKLLFCDQDMDTEIRIPYERDDIDFYYDERDYIPYAKKFKIKKQDSFYILTDRLHLDIENQMLKQRVRLNKHRYETIPLHTNEKMTIQITYAFEYEEEHPKYPQCKDVSEDISIEEPVSHCTFQVPDTILSSVATAQQLHFSYTLYISIAATIIDQDETYYVDALYMDDYYRKEAQQGIYVFQFFVDYFRSLQQKTAFCFTPQDYRFQWADQDGQASIMIPYHEKAKEEPLLPLDAINKRLADSYKSILLSVSEDLPAGEYILFANPKYKDSYSCASCNIFENMQKRNIPLVTKTFKKHEIIAVKDGQAVQLSECKIVEAEKVKLRADSEGIYRVGIDLPDGEYAIKTIFGEHKGTYCITAEPNDTVRGLERHSIFTNDFITLEERQYIYLYLCVAVPAEEFAPDPSQEGTFRVGIDIAPGEYVIYNNRTQEKGCYRIYSDSRIPRSPIQNISVLTNDIITVFDGQYLELRGCTAKKAEKAHIDTSGEGTFRVGIDLLPGSYEFEVFQPYRSGSFAILSDTVGTGSIIKQGFFKPPKSIQLTEGQYIRIHRCRLIKKE